MHAMTDEEVKKLTERRMQLRTSDYIIDVITSMLMDTNIGSHGLHETVARTKADSILRSVGIDIHAKVNRNLTPDGFKLAATATGVLRQ